MNQLLTSLQSLLVASWDVVLAVLMLVSPWTPLLVWVAFWMLAVDWVKLRAVMIKGGWIGVALMGLVMVSFLWWRRNEAQSHRPPLPERPLEARLPAQWLVAATTRRAERRKRTDAAARHASEAHRRAEIHQSLPAFRAK